MSVPLLFEFMLVTYYLGELNYLKLKVVPHFDYRYLSHRFQQITNYDMFTAFSLVTDSLSVINCVSN